MEHYEQVVLLLQQEHGCTYTSSSWDRCPEEDRIRDDGVHQFRCNDKNCPNCLHHSIQVSNMIANGPSILDLHGLNIFLSQLTFSTQLNLVTVIIFFICLLQVIDCCCKSLLHMSHAFMFFNFNSLSIRLFTIQKACCFAISITNYTGVSKKVLLDRSVPDT